MIFSHDQPHAASPVPRSCPAEAAHPARSAASGGPARSGRRRRPGALLALLAVLLLAMWPVPAQADPPRSVTLTDTQAVLRTGALTEQLEATDFRRPVDLVVLVLDVTDHDLSPSSDVALNDAVLLHARERQPELLSAAGDHFADGTVILALDPTARLLGTYAGEDVKLSDGQFSTVQDAMRDDAREQEWEAALIAGAERYAQLLDRPWWLSPAGMITIGVTALVLGAAGIGVLEGRSRARQRVDLALPRYRDILASRAGTDAAARTLPMDSPYAPAVLEQHERFTAQVDELAELHEQLPAAEERGWSWGLAKNDQNLSLQFSRLVTKADDLDDRILRTNDLLHRIGDWREAWEAEVAPLRDSLDALDKVLDPQDGTGIDTAPSEAEQEVGAELVDLSERARAEIGTTTSQLEEDRITPDDALGRLDTLTAELSATVARLRDARITTVSEDEEEAEMMREAAAEPSDSRHHSIRELRHRREHGTADPAQTFWNLSPLLWYTQWHHTAGALVHEHRNPSVSSSTTSTSGFSPGVSGGFSGAGSSSRF